MTPYKNLPDHQFWKRSISNVPIHQVDLVKDTKFKILPSMKVATAGSCFAQHIARVLKNSGFHYLVTEHDSQLSEAEYAARGYGTFTARFANIYTAAQLLQLLEEAYEIREPIEQPWARQDSRYADPFRPTIEPDGFESADAVKQSRLLHLQAVREMVETADVFMFTLGLTEAWRSKLDSSVFPVVPGAAAGEFNPLTYEFHNYGIAEVVRDLFASFQLMKSKNANLKSVVTVSPVPLIATYENRHVLTSTTYSKSVLRVAAEELCRSEPWIDYFPSYEIITGNFNRGRYYEDDLREVNSVGVHHAMKSFMKHYARGAETEAEVPQSSLRTSIDDNEVICEEELLDQVS